MKQEKPEIIVITGPTGTGKTALSILLAKTIGGEVVGADSMQIYKYMDIGTAKPDEKEMDGVRHHMIDVVSPFEGYSVSRYVDEASKCVDDIIKRGKTPILVGGTGLYIDSLLSGRNFAQGGEEIIGDREKLNAKYDALGGGEMLRLLSEFDPESAVKLHANDKKRIVRAFEVYEVTGKTISQHNLETKSIPPRYNAVKLALSFHDRELMYDRINKRVDIMLEMGLLEEVENLLKMGLTKEHTAMQAIGYKELTGYFSGEGTLEDALEKIKMESRRYAKRQLSWLRRDDTVKWILRDKTPDFPNELPVSTEFLERYGIIQS